MNYLISVLYVLFFSAYTYCQIPSVSSGTIIRHESFQSSYVSARHIDVWLPNSYTHQKKYAVLYMQDGQMLYDSSTTWNKQAWEVDAVAAIVQQNKRVKDFIVVGIWNGGNTRHKDYFPQKPFDGLLQIQKDSIIQQLKDAGRTNESFQPISDNYLLFIVNELKPFIDTTYSTYTNRENTFIAGSSMGGLISLYAICEYPNVFGGAACMSTHWPGTFSIENNPIPQAFFHYLQSYLPNPQTHKIYFDYGDQTLDALYPPLQQRVDTLMQNSGYNNNNWITKFFPGENHSEQAWSKRLHLPLLFLLQKN